MPSVCRSAGVNLRNELVLEYVYIHYNVVFIYLYYKLLY